MATTASGTDPNGQLMTNPHSASACGAPATPPFAPPGHWRNHGTHRQGPRRHDASRHRARRQNAAARAVGIEPGRKCFTLCGPDKPCAACRANQAVRDDACVRSLSYTEAGNRFVDGYWTPLAGVPGLFLHYANDITQCVREELLRPGCTC